MELLKRLGRLQTGRRLLLRRPRSRVEGGED